jgi:hypothetical protein
MAEGAASGRIPKIEMSGRGYRNLCTNSKVVEDQIAGHNVPLDDPDTVVTAIREVLNAAQRHTPLLP